jgi:hypothetical protein
MTSYNSKLDIYWIIILILSLILLKKNINNYKIFIIFLLSIIGVFIHQGFIFVTMPFICVLLYEKIEKNKKIIILFYMASVGISFIICQFFGKVEYLKILEYVSNRAEEANINSEYIKLILMLEYEMNVFDHLEFLQEAYFGYHIPCFIAIFCISIIGTVLSIMLFKKLYKKNYILYFIFLLLCQIPLIALTTDLDRWFLLFMLQINILNIYKLSNNNNYSDIKFTFKVNNIFHIYLFIIHTTINLFFLYILDRI